MVIGFPFVQFFRNYTCDFKMNLPPVGLFDFEIVQMISDQIVLYSVQLSLFIITLSFHKAELQHLARF